MAFLSKFGVYYLGNAIHNPRTNKDQLHFWWCGFIELFMLLNRFNCNIWVGLIELNIRARCSHIPLQIYS